MKLDTLTMLANYLLKLNNAINTCLINRNIILLDISLDIFMRYFWISIISVYYSIILAVYYSTKALYMYPFNLVFFHFIDFKTFWNIY